MSLFTKIVDFASGGIGSKIVDTVTKYLPPQMTPAEKIQIEQSIIQATREYELQLLTLAQAEQEQFNERLKEHEGTASDLTNSGVFGKVIVFLRGAQRPIWGYATMVLDTMVFSGRWELQGSSGMVDQQSAFWLINALVLGFLFGERALKNVMPLIKKDAK
jgi:hypothetical protein